MFFGVCNVSVRGVEGGAMNAGFVTSIASSLKVTAEDTQLGVYARVLL